MNRDDIFFTFAFLVLMQVELALSVLAVTQPLLFGPCHPFPPGESLSGFLIFRPAPGLTFGLRSPASQIEVHGGNAISVTRRRP